MISPPGATRTVHIAELAVVFEVKCRPIMVSAEIEAFCQQIGKDRLDTALALGY